jgi:hypothetical protein
LIANESPPKSETGQEKASLGKNVADAKRPWDEDLSRAPKQCIFLSIDIIDSTRLKISKDGEKSTSGPWVKNFAWFLNEIIVIYRRKLSEILGMHYSNSCSEKHAHGVNTRVWKYLGDEAVLTAELTCEKHHATLLVLALAETIKYFNEESGGDSSNKIRYKGTAWVAGFPVQNIELDLPVSEGRKERDFLGSSMDLGFRLAKAASYDRLIISASLAYLIIENLAMDKPLVLFDSQHEYLPLCFGGLKKFKGIKGNKHPLIWYPVNATRKNKSRLIRHNKLRGFLTKKSYINTKDPPFILGTGDVTPEY